MSFNRTIVELKRRCDDGSLVMDCTFNRTIVELKPNLTATHYAQPRIF